MLCPIQHVKPLSRRYGEVSDYDLVIVPDAPLASALNRRLDRPHFGTFATTPRRLAAGRREQAEDRVALLDVVDGAAATRFVGRLRALVEDAHGLETQREQ